MAQKDVKSQVCDQAAVVGIRLSPAVNVARSHDSRASVPSFALLGQFFPSISCSALPSRVVGMVTCGTGTLNAGGGWQILCWWQYIAFSSLLVRWCLSVADDIVVCFCGHDLS